jgi:hypothetical protein
MDRVPFSNGTQWNILQYKNEGLGCELSSNPGSRFVMALLGFQCFWVLCQIQHIDILACQIIDAILVDVRSRAPQLRFQITINQGKVMRRSLATVSNFAVLSLALAGATFIPRASYGGPSELNRVDRLPAENLRICGPDDIAVYEQSESKGAIGCSVRPRTATEVADARAYLVETASPGYTMTLQGAELAIERLHPEFAVRLANAIREARDSGLPSAGIFSAYRPPAFGIGGFADKFNSLHSYGLAADLRGIGDPGSPEAQLWHEIAARNGVICPYGPNNKTEWNHCQPTALKIVGTHNPLRDTITADGPLSLEDMFEVGDSIIENATIFADNIPNEVPAHLVVHESKAAKSREPLAASAVNERTKQAGHVEDKSDKRRERLAGTAAGKTTKQASGHGDKADKQGVNKMARLGGKQVFAKKVLTVEEKRGARRSLHHLTLVVVSSLRDRV